MHDFKYSPHAGSLEAIRVTRPEAVVLRLNNHHEKYDIKRCFDIGWKSGFRGPWAIEHWNDDTKAYVRETT